MWEWHCAAADRQAKPDSSRRVDPIDGRGVAELLDVDAPLLVDHRVAMKTGGDSLVEGRARKQVAGDLLNGEAVKRHVVVEGPDDPVAVGPDRAFPVFLIAIGIGVTGAIEPVSAPALAVMRRGEKPLDQPLVSVRA